MRRVNDKGSVMMETVLLMPILFILIMGVLQLAEIWMARQVVKYAAYCAARATLTSNTVTAHSHAYEAARQVCAWITFSEKAEEMATGGGTDASTGQDDDGRFGVEEAIGFVGGMVAGSVGSGAWGRDEVEVPGWGKIPHSGSVDRRLRVVAGIIEPQNLLFKWETQATVEFDFPLLMPVAGRMLSYLVNRDADELQQKLETGEVGVRIGSGWTGQQEILESEKDKEGHAFPYITLRETCILPKPYSTAVYPITSFDMEQGISGLLR